MVAPALGKGDLVPALACLWFDGQRVLAYDDHIGISAPCAAGIHGGLNGALLLPFLERSGLKEIDIIVKDTVTFTMGSGKDQARLKLSLMDKGHAPFIMPKPKGTTTTGDAKQFGAALKHCLKSVGNDVSRPEWFGITLEVKDKSLWMYSGTGQTLVRAEVQLHSKPKFKRTILPAAFCEQLLAHAKDKKAQLEIHDDHAMLSSGDILVFGRAIAAEEALDMWDIVETALAKGGDYIPTPTLRFMLDRADLFDTGDLNMNLTVNGSKVKGKSTLTLFSSSASGELNDSKQIDAHPEVSVQTNVKHLRSGADLDEMTINEDNIIMRSDDIVQVISVA